MINKTKFESIGVYTPEKVVSTKSLIDQMDEKPIFDLEDLTGIINRRMRSESENSLTIALDAARKCIDNSEYDASDLDIIINASITRFLKGSEFYFEPTLSQVIKDEIDAKQAMNFDITNACAGMITGAYILDNMIKSGIVKNGMVVSGECITPICDTAIREICEPIDEQFASLTVGDAGAAFIMDESTSTDEGIEEIEITTFAEHSDLCFGMPSKKNTGVAMYTKAMEIHKEAISRMPNSVKWVTKKGYNPSNIDYIIPHQTSKRAIETAMNTFGEIYGSIPEILYSLQDYGNTASTSHFVVLYNYLKEKKFKRGDRILLLSQASGLVLGSLMLKIGSLEVNNGSIN